jgi:hypothetical protein
MTAILILNRKTVPEAQLPNNNNNDYVGLVRERTILTERPLLVGEVSGIFCG